MAAILFSVGGFSLAQQNSIRDRVAQLSKAYPNDDSFRQAITESIDSLLANEEHNNAGEWMHETARLYSRSDELPKAIEFTSRAIELKELAQPIDSLLLQKSVSNLAQYYYVSGEWTKALKVNKDIMSFGLTSRFEAKALCRSGYILREQGNYFGSIEYLEQGLRLANQVNDFGTLNTAAPMLASSLNLMVDSTSSERAIAILNELEDEDLNSSQLIDKSLEMGNALEFLDQDNRAIAAFNEMAEQAEFAEEPEAMVKALNSKGYVLNKMMSFKAAQNILLKGLGWANENNIENHRLVNNLADSYAGMSQDKLAAEHYKMALSVAGGRPYQDIMTSWTENITDYKNKDDLVQYLNDLASFSITSESIPIEEGIEAFRFADLLIDQIRREALNNQSNLFWRGLSDDLYGQAVKASLAIDDINSAFYFMEKNKAVILLEQLQESAALRNANIDSDLLNEERRLRMSIVELESRIDNNEEALNELKKELLISREQLHEIQEKLMADNTSYRLQKRGVEIKSVKELQSTLAEDEALLSSVIHEGKLYHIVISSSTAAQHVVDFDGSMVNQFLDFVSRPLLSKNDEVAFRETSLMLADLLLPGGLEGINKITIAPDGLLSYVPYEAILFSGTKDEYFIGRMSVSYAYSHSIRLNKSIKAQGSKFIAFAPVDFPSRQLASLPNNLKNELASVGSRKEFVGKDGSSSNFFDTASSASVLHLNTHAGVVEDSYIAFHDKNITQSQLYGLDIPAQLVVLGACETLDGRLAKGEGVMSLSRSFMSSGAKSVMASLWKVNDRATSSITASFYDNWTDNMDASEALRQAKLEYLASHSLSELSPYYWSSFVLVGDAGKFEKPKTSFPKTGIAVLCLLFLAGLAFILKRPRH